MTNLIPRIEFLIQAIFKSQKYCPHCHSSNSTVLATKYIFIKIKQCSSCYLNYTSPIYKPLFLNKFYDYFYSGEGSTTNLPSKEGLKKLLKSDFSHSDKYFKERIGSIKSIRIKGSSLVEIGSSWGYFLWQAKNQGFDVAGVEIGERRRLFGERHLGVKIVDDINVLKENSFDIVYTSHVLEHFTDISEIFKKIYSLLNERGKL